mmetsp:Transcript_77785/g.207807  ORF Transcript_77785/g.207807 Transcript_77785/m.207807 type:complete len:436 (+) Transcript_77785:428-1735(+)
MSSHSQQKDHQCRHPHARQRLVFHLGPGEEPGRHREVTTGSVLRVKALRGTEGDIQELNVSPGAVLLVRRRSTQRVIPPAARARRAVLQRQRALRRLEQLRCLVRPRPLGAVAAPERRDLFDHLDPPRGLRTHEIRHLHVQQRHHIGGPVLLHPADGGEIIQCQVPGVLRDPLNGGGVTCHTPGGVLGRGPEVGHGAARRTAHPKDIFEPKHRSGVHLGDLQVRQHQHHNKNTDDNSTGRLLRQLLPQQRGLLGALLLPRRRRRRGPGLLLVQVRPLLPAELQEVRDTGHTEQADQPHETDDPPGPGAGLGSVPGLPQAAAPRRGLREILQDGVVDPGDIRNQGKRGHEIHPEKEGKFVSVLDDTFEREFRQEEYQGQGAQDVEHRVRRFCKAVQSKIVPVEGEKGNDHEQELDAPGVEELVQAVPEGQGRAGPI